MPGSRPKPRRYRGVPRFLYARYSFQSFFFSPGSLSCSAAPRNRRAITSSSFPSGISRGDTPLLAGGGLAMDGGRMACLPAPACAGLGIAGSGREGCDAEGVTGEPASGAGVGTGFGGLATQPQRTAATSVASLDARAGCASVQLAMKGLIRPFGAPASCGVAEIAPGRPQRPQESRRLPSQRLRQVRTGVQ